MTAVRRFVAEHARAFAPGSVRQAAPGLAGLLHYDRSNLRHDLIAGVTVGAIAVPASLAMAELAGLPIVFGMYATFLPLAVYGLLASSRQIVVGPEATLAALTAATIAPLATVKGHVDPSLYAAMAAALALGMGLILLVAGLLRLGFIADFFGKPVLLGYINGVAVIVIATQFEKLLGIDVVHTDFVPMVKETISKVGELNWPTVVLSVVLLAVALACKRFVPVFPASLAVLVAGLVIARFVDLQSHEISVVGDVQGGLPPIGLPHVGLSRFVNLLLPAGAFALVAFADTTATARSFAQRHGYELDANRELTALGGANMIGGITSGFPISASGSRSAVNDSTGAATQLAVIVASIVVGAFLLFAMPLIEPLPKAALGVIIVIAAAGLIQIRPIWRLRLVRPAEFALAVIAFVGVLLFGVVGGVGFAIAVSIGVFIYRAARPHDAILGEVEGLDGYHDIERWQGAHVIPGLLVYRFDAPPFFVNAEYLRQRVLELVSSAEQPEWVLLNAEAWMFLDATAIDALKQLHRDLAAYEIRLCFARLKSQEQEIFAKTGVTDQIGAESIFPTVASAVKAFESREPRAPVSTAERGAGQTVRPAPREEGPPGFEPGTKEL